MKTVGAGTGKKPTGYREDDELKGKARHPKSYIGVADAATLEAGPDKDLEEQMLVAFSQLVVVQELLFSEWQSNERQTLDGGPFDNCRMGEAAFRLMEDSLGTLRGFDITSAVLQARSIKKGGRDDEGSNQPQDEQMRSGGQHLRPTARRLLRA